MNFVQLEKSRKKKRPGDIFVYQLKQEPNLYRFGKIIKTDAVVGNLVGTKSNLIYLYEAISNSKLDIPVLDKNKLLLPPLGINNLPWTRGYFVTVGFEEVTEKNSHAVHCFRCDSRKTPTYYNEYSKEIHKIKGYIGEHGLHSYLSLDDYVSVKLGYPVEEDDF